MRWSVFFLVSWQRLGLACLSSVVGLVLLSAGGNKVPYEHYAAQKEAAILMQRCEQAIRAMRESIGIPPDTSTDPNRTAMIGPEYSPFITTTGNLEAKRTSASPAFAALLVRYFTILNLQKGDAVLIGASGSFPGLMLATLSAAHVLELRPILIYSYGSSVYGAAHELCTGPDMLVYLKKNGILPYLPIAVSMGGGNDQADDLIFPEARSTLVEKMYQSGYPVIDEPTLRQSEEKRLTLYKTALTYEAATSGANGWFTNRYNDRYTEKPDRPNGTVDGAGTSSGPVATHNHTMLPSVHQPRRVGCFVNIGGASVNVGMRAFALTLPSGLIYPERMADSLWHKSLRKSGLAAHFLQRNIPVIHLLDIRHLSLHEGIDFDPVPFPEIGKEDVYYKTIIPPPFLLSGGLCFVVGWGILIDGYRRKRKQDRHKTLSNMMSQNVLQSLSGKQR